MALNEAAYQSGRSLRTFRKLIDDGTVRAVRVGRRTLVRGEDVSELVRTAEPYTPRRLPGLKGHAIAQQDDEEAAARERRANKLPTRSNFIPEAAPEPAAAGPTRSRRRTPICSSTRRRFAFEPSGDGANSTVTVTKRKAASPIRSVNLPVATGDR
jgi:excisionase family DNA binding protein